ncbi:MAG TPA: GNAT family N-acetyltransferase [Tepidisphaeraceae bacterium]|nr:GNAT family N-acetyltransferase [Tepidisphaeraceae bacterium]
MPLPIVQTVHEPPAADLLRLFYKCDTEWVGHLAEPEQIEVGTALASAELAEVWNANHVRDVGLPPGMTPAGAWAEVAAHFAARGTRCGYWTMSVTAPAERVRPMAEFLLAKGCRADASDVMYLRHAPSVVVPVPKGLQVIPARASYRHAGELARARADEMWGGSARVADAAVLHLDDPRWDALLALEDGTTVAGAGVLAVGELGLVEQVYVAPAHRRRGVGRYLVGRALEICARAQFRHVFLSVSSGNEAAKALYRSMGFERIGQVVAYLTPP